MSLNETTNSDEAPDATGTAAQSSGPKTKAHWSKLNVKAMKVVIPSLDFKT